MDVFTIAEPESRDDDRAGFVANPADLYPAALAEVVRVVQTAERPSGALGLLYDRAQVLQTIDPDAYKRALTGKPGDSGRAEALEIARLWFTELLHAAIDHAPMGLHITKDEHYKL